MQATRWIIGVVVLGVGLAGALAAWQASQPPGSMPEHARADEVPEEGAPIIGDPSELPMDLTVGAAADAALDPPGKDFVGPFPDGAGPVPVELTDPPVNEDGVRLLSFDLLGSFDYEVAMDSPDEAVDRRWQMPGVIQRLDGQEVEIEGYMLPLDFERGRVQSFYLNRDTNACCFGVIPPVNEVIRVHMPKKKGVPNYSNIPIIVTGKFRIMETAGDFGFVTSIFRIDAEIVEKSTWQ